VPVSERSTSILRATYTIVAPVYDEIVPLVSSAARATGRKWLAVQDNEQVLDVGTGTGLALPPLLDANPSGWTEAVDLTPAMLARAERRLAKVSHRRCGLRQADATALPYRNDTFDAAFSSYLLDVLAHSQIHPALREMRRVVRPEGRVVLVYLSPANEGIEHFWSDIAHCFPLFFGGARPINLRCPLRECGFEIQSQTNHTEFGLRSTITLATPTSGTETTAKHA